MYHAILTPRAVGVQLVLAFALEGHFHSLQAAVDDPEPGNGTLVTG